MKPEKIKNLPMRESIYIKIVACAAARGMSPQGLAERIFRSWLDENFFADIIANSNNDGSVSGNIPF